jgi:hypothetical protein
MSELVSPGRVNTLWEGGLGFVLCLLLLVAVFRGVEVV